MKNKLKVCISVIIAVALIGLIGFLVYNIVTAKSEEVVNPVATFEIQDYGTVKMELYPEYAPNTVANFIALIESGYYNNKVVYGKDSMCLYMARNADEDDETAPTLSLIDDSVEADSDDDYEYEIDGEFISNGFDQNTLRHEKGVLSLNRSDYSSYGLTEESYNSGSYRFSIMMTDESNLNGVYCAFGKVTEGLDILEQIYNDAEIASSETDESEDVIDTTEDEEEDDEDTIKEFASKPVITSASVETYGVEYGKPEVHEAFDIQNYISELYSSYYSY